MISYEAFLDLGVVFAYLVGVGVGVLASAPWAERDCPLCRKFARMWEKRNGQS